MKTQELVAFRTDVFQEIQTKMFPPLFIMRKNLKKGFIVSVSFPCVFWRTEKTNIDTEPISKYTQPPLPGLGRRAETTASV